MTVIGANRAGASAGRAACRAARLRGDHPVRPRTFEAQNSAWGWFVALPEFETSADCELYDAYSRGWYDGYAWMDLAPVRHVLAETPCTTGLCSCPL